MVSLPYRGRQLARQIVQNRIDAPALLELISALTTESAAMKLQEMGMKYIGPPRPSSPSGLSTPCYYNLGLFSRKDGVGQEAGQPVCGSQGMSELMKSVREWFPQHLLPSPHVSGSHVLLRPTTDGTSNVGVLDDG